MFIISTPMWIDLIRIVVGLAGFWVAVNSVMSLKNATRQTPAGEPVPLLKSGMLKILFGSNLIGLATVTGSSAYLCFPGL